MNQPHSIPIIVGGEGEKRGEILNERGNFPFLLFLFPCLSSSLPTRSIRGNFSHMTCNDYKLQSTLIQQESEEKVGNKFENTFPFYPRGGRSVSVGEIGGHNTYEAGIIHRIGAKCLFTSSFELSKLGTISDLRLGSRQVPRVRSVIYVSPSPKRDAPPTDHHSTHLQTPFADQAHLPLHFNHYS